MTIKQQFERLKSTHKDALLLFRCGDFYETYNEDADKASRTLGITLTKRGETKMAGFPHHALDSYLPKLIRAGHRVAICDQLDTPRPTARRSIADLKPRKVQLPSLTKEQYELLCECIRYRKADNDKERADAVSHDIKSAYYDSIDERLAELKELFYNLK